MSSPSGYTSDDTEDYAGPQFKYQTPQVPQTGLSPAMQWIMPAVLAAATAYRPRTLGPAAQTFGQVFDTIQAQKARQAQLGMENQWRDIGQQARLAHYGAQQGIEQKQLAAMTARQAFEQQRAAGEQDKAQAAADAYKAQYADPDGNLAPVDSGAYNAIVKGNDPTTVRSWAHPQAPDAKKVNPNVRVMPNGDLVDISPNPQGPATATKIYSGPKPPAGDGGEKAPNLGALKGQKDVILGKIRQLGIDDPTDPRATDGLTEIELEKFNNLSSKLDDVNEKLAAAGVPVKAPTKPGAGAGVIPGVNSPAGKALASKYGL